MPPAARLLDMHVCPLFTGPVPHVGGPVLLNQIQTLTGMMPQATLSTMCVCVGPPDMIVKGSITVLVSNKPAARMGDLTAHGGSIIIGLPTVMIGDAGAGGGGGGGNAPGQDAPAGDASILTNFHQQEQANSCVIATSRNIIQYYTGQDIPEAQLRQEMRTIMNSPGHNFNTTPINPIHASQLLANHGVPNTVLTSHSMDSIEGLVQNNDPVMVGFTNPGHRVAVGGVTRDAAGNRTWSVLDPATNTPTQMTDAQFQNRYNPNAIVIVPN
jgi:uncharacterized Zn-binding protein involved in type VI secretion